ncbi:hypothetical protein IEN85_11440 [Pelagicoccus sp. NFK12]|uniref:Uncharacterized protein n=1 Tax=Pelagicoccus enzymogenes TaxID=2773457 RepID=A0A927II41_9BACT|nr:hypothetical protein [Pelagicoccus enzymogenes]MBD5780105.1 hypothetical protein [Pelagicoccus enzymogenes]MDQ8200649.1 hypothetical protein [Pelagicoccus enzymogenes]
MKDLAGKPIEIVLGNGERIQIASSQLGDPDKALIVERALELAALKSRAGAPEHQDFELAARELSVDAKVLECGDSTRVEGPGKHPIPTQVLNQPGNGVH